MDHRLTSLPEPTVAAAVYDEDYYRNWCAGFAEWTASDGSKVSGIYPGVLQLAGLRQGDVLVDIGTGRGEMLAVAVKLGARRAIGVEYSPTAVRMARQTIEAHGVGLDAEIHLADARAVPVEDGTVDLVTMVDVVEHLSPDELDHTLREAHRVLRPGGRFFAHTMPNRTIYDTTYRIQRLLSRRRRRSWPADPRNEYEHTMHVNEQTLSGLRRTLRNAGFADARVRLGTWVYTDFVPDHRARALYHRLAGIPPLRRLAIWDLFAEAVRR